MLQERLSRTRQYRSGRARPIALGAIALCCGLAFRVDPGGLQLWATRDSLPRLVEFARRDHVAVRAGGDENAGAER